MKINTKRLLSMLMALCMVIGMVPSLALNVHAKKDEIRAEFDIIKEVKVQGVDKAPDATFEFEIYTLSPFNNKNVATKGKKLTSIPINTTGAGIYKKSVNLMEKDVDRSVYKLIVEKNSGVENWTYHPETLGYVVEFYNAGGQGRFRIHAAYIDGKKVTLGPTVNAASFTNIYTEPVTNYLNLPFTNTVELKGVGEVPAVDFEFTLNKLTNVEFEDGKPIEAKVGGEVDSTVVATNGVGSYEGSFKLESKDPLYGWYVLSEVDNSDEYWKYGSEVAYVVRIDEAVVASLDEDITENSSYKITYYKALKDNTTITLFREMNTGSKMEFINEYYAPEAVRIEVPFTKTVELGGNTEPGKTEFQLEMIQYGDYDVVIENDTIVTDGKGNYEGVFSFLIGEEDLDMLSEGFVLKEVAVEDDKWECDTTPWLVVAYPQEVNSLEDRDITEISMNIVTHEAKLDEAGEYVPVDNTPDDIVFVNTYTENTVNPPVQEYDPEPTPKDKVVVKKVWVGDDEKTRPEEITVQLYKNGKKYEKPVKLSADEDIYENWRHVWDDVREDEDTVWSVKELNVPDGYSVSIEQRRSNYFIITNTLNEKPNPDTGASDFVGAAVALAVCSAVSGAALMLKRK